MITLFFDLLRWPNEGISKSNAIFCISWPLWNPTFSWWNNLSSRVNTPEGCSGISKICLPSARGHDGLSRQIESLFLQSNGYRNPLLRDGTHSRANEGRYTHPQPSQFLERLNADTSTVRSSTLWSDTDYLISAKWQKIMQPEGIEPLQSDHATGALTTALTNRKWISITSSIDNLPSRESTGQIDKDPQLASYVDGIVLLSEEVRDGYCMQIDRPCNWSMRRGYGNRRVRKADKWRLSECVLYRSLRLEQSLIIPYCPFVYLSFFSYLSFIPPFFVYSKFHSYAHRCLLFCPYFVTTTAFLGLSGWKIRSACSITGQSSLQGGLLVCFKPDSVEIKRRVYRISLAI